MPEWPPWEWAEGDPVRAGRISYALGLFMGGGVVLLLLILLAMFGLVTVAWPPITPLSSQLLTWALLSVAIGVPAFLPRRIPMVVRLGISPVGVRLRMAFPFSAARHEIVAWSHVRRVGPDWIEVYGFRGLGIFPERYVLTAWQARRLRSFLGPYLPLGA